MSVYHFLKAYIAGFLATSVILSSFWYRDFDMFERNYNQASDREVSADPFPEPPWLSPATLERQVVVSTRFARFEIHRVRGVDGSVVNDWLWTDERSHVNIIVHLKSDNKFMLFKQKKYGLENEKYATVGGLFNNGESPQECAERELLEETGLVPELLVDLGKYRVQADRGGGLLFAFLAKNCVLASAKEKLKSDDYEKQLIKKLSAEELLGIIKEGEVGESQWLATAALGLLHELYSHSPSLE